MSELTRSQVLNGNEAMRRGNTRKPTRLPDGEVEFRIPTEDYAMLMRKFPWLQHKDPAIRLHAWKTFRASPMGEKYLVVRSPSQVQRSHNNRIIVK